MSESLKLGDIVCLKSGSVPLTVTCTNRIYHGYEAVEVTWWSDELDEIVSRDLPLGALCYVAELSAEAGLDDDQPANGGTTH